MRLDEFVQPVQERTRQEFVRAYPHPVLLLYLEKDEAAADWSFKTTTVASKKLSVAKLLDRSDLSLSSESNRFRIFPLIKSGENPWQERISIGRARNNDIVLPHKSVSKLHAHFVQGHDGSFGVIDAGSRNGTRLNEDRLSAGQLAHTKSGDTVTFGAVSLTFIDAQELYDLVKKHLRPRARDA